jgi:hypothetical protein
LSIEQGRSLKWEVRVRKEEGIRRKDGVRVKK